MATPAMDYAPGFLKALDKCRESDEFRHKVLRHERGTLHEYQPLTRKECALIEELCQLLESRKVHYQLKTTVVDCCDDPPCD